MLNQPSLCILTENIHLANFSCRVMTMYIDYAKNYCNRSLIVQVILENVVTCFFWDTVYEPHFVVIASIGIASQVGAVARDSEGGVCTRVVPNEISTCSLLLDLERDIFDKNRRVATKEPGLTFSKRLKKILRFLIQWRSQKFFTRGA